MDLAIFASAAWGVGRGSKIPMDDKVYFPHSFGAVLQSLTQLIGFPTYGDEYKVMGLALYGEPKYMEEMRRIVRLQDDGAFRLDMDYFLYHKEKVSYEWEDGSFAVGRRFSARLAELLGPERGKNEELPQRHKDIGRSVHGMYEEAFSHLLNRLHARHDIESLCLAGGCAMNSVTNGKVRRHTPFNRVYIQSEAGDAGGTIGAAFAVSS